MRHNYGHIRYWLGDWRLDHPPSTRRRITAGTSTTGAAALNYSYSNFGNYNQETAILELWKKQKQQFGKLQCPWGQLQLNYNVETGNGQWNVRQEIMELKVGKWKHWWRGTQNSQYRKQQCGWVKFWHFKQSPEIQNSGSSNLGTNNTREPRMSDGTTRETGISAHQTRAMVMGSSIQEISVLALNLGSKITLERGIMERVMWDTCQGLRNQRLVNRKRRNLLWKNVQKWIRWCLSAVKSNGLGQFEPNKRGNWAIRIPQFGIMDIGRKWNIGSLMNGTIILEGSGSDLIGTNQDWWSSGAGDAYTPVTINGIKWLSQHPFEFISFTATSRTTDFHLLPNVSTILFSLVKHCHKWIEHIHLSKLRTLAISNTF